MKKIIVSIVFISLLLSSCTNNKPIEQTNIQNDLNGKIDENIKNENISKKESNSEQSRSDNPNKINTNNEIDNLSKIYPFNELFEYKKWRLLEIPSDNNWNFINKDGKRITISYKGSPYIGGKTTLIINNIEIIDKNDCTEWQKKEGTFNEDDPIFVTSECKKYYYGFSFNGKEINYDFKNSMDGIYISKKENLLIIYGGKLIINIDTNSYEIKEKGIDLNKDNYILLKLVY